MALPTSKKAKEQLKIYRQAVLKKAFEGELTKEWRKNYVKTDGRPSQLPTAEQLLKQIKEEREKNYKLQITNWKKNKKMKDNLIRDKSIFQQISRILCRQNQ